MKTTVRFVTTVVSCIVCWHTSKLLEAIGAKRRTNKKTNSPGNNYQNAVGVPLSEDADNDAATQEGEDEAEADPSGSEDLQAPFEFILPAVDKVSAFYCINPFSLDL